MATPRTADPFDLMINPQAILMAMEKSERLQHLDRHVYRPLDRPIIPKVGGLDVSEADAMIEAQADLSGETLDA